MCISYLTLVVPGLIAVQWPTTALSQFMDVSAIVLANHLLPFRLYMIRGARTGLPPQGDSVIGQMCVYWYPPLELTV